MIGNGENPKNKKSKAKNVKKANTKILFRKKCKGKYSYDKKGARTALNNIKKQGKGCLRMYYCKICNAWHLTHKESFDEDIDTI